MTNDVVKCMNEICCKAAIIFKKHTPKELKDRCEQLAYVCHQADAMGIIIEKLVEQGYLLCLMSKPICAYMVLGECLMNNYIPCSSGYRGCFRINFN